MRNGVVEPPRSLKQSKALWVRLEREASRTTWGVCFRGLGAVLAA